MKEQNVILNYPWITHKDVFLKFQGTPESEHPLIILEYVYFRVSIQRNEKCSLASFILRWSSREFPKKSVLPLSHIDRLSQYAPQHTVRGQIRNPRVLFLKNVSTVKQMALSLGGLVIMFLSALVSASQLSAVFFPLISIMIQLLLSCYQPTHKLTILTPNIAWCSLEFRKHWRRNI